METCLVRLVPDCRGRRTLGGQRVFWVPFFFPPHLQPKMEKNYLELKQAMLLDLQNTHQYVNRKDRAVLMVEIKCCREQCVSCILTTLLILQSKPAHCLEDADLQLPGCDGWCELAEVPNAWLSACSVSAGLLKNPRDTSPTFPALGLPLFPFRDVCTSSYLPRNVHSNDGNQQGNLRCAWTSLDVSKSRLSILMKPPSSQRVLLGLFKGSYYTECQLEDNCFFQSQKLLL